MIKKITLFVVSIFCCFYSFAFDFYVLNDDRVKIYYNIDGDNVSVTYGGDYYKFRLNIPQEVTYLDKTYTVTSIGENAFYNCSELTNISIPSSVTKIGDYAFYGCSELVEINSKNPIPAEASETAFIKVDKTKCILDVPFNSIDAYKNTPVWKDFFNITSSINQITNNVNISILKINDGIRIDGCNNNDNINIYSISGQLLHNSKIGNGDIKYHFNNGIYIIQTPKKSFKIAY